MMEKHWRLLFCFLSSTAYVSSSTISRLEIIPERTYLILLEGDPLQLECHAIYSGNQTVFHFYKDGAVITTDNKFGYEIIYTEERVKLSDNFETYKITTVLRKNITQFGDKGHYECKALDSVPVTIIVEIFSGFSTNADLSTEGTESVELECTVNIPAITKYTFITYNMFWEHDGKRIEENERFSCYNGTLQFHYPTRSDLGIYQCVITFFPDSLVEKQSVRPKPSLLRGGPQIDYYSKSRAVMVGEFLELRCEASGFPTPKVTWYKDNQEIVAGSNMRILEYGNSTSYLNITSINKNDEGKYVCRAKNPVPPFTTSADIYVTVKEKSPDVSSSLSVHSHTSFLSYLLLTMMTFITFLCSSYLCK